MSNHHKHRPRQRATGPIDRDRDSPSTKMDRELENTDASRVSDRDLRGMGRQAVEQQQLEQDFDQIDRDLSAERSKRRRG
jgi:hypothetical protein